MRAPDLIVEIAASSVSIDLHDKLRAYRRAGVREYLIWRTVERQFDWLVLEHDEYRPNLPDAQKLIHSPYFPGLTLALDSMLALESAKVLDALQADLSTPAHAAFVKQLSISMPKQIVLRFGRPELRLTIRRETALLRSQPVEA